MPRKQGTTIWVSPEIKRILQGRKHPGQSFEGVIIEMLRELEKKCVSTDG